MSENGGLSRLIDRMLRLLRARDDNGLRESLEALIEQRAEEAGEDAPPALDPHERALIANVLKLRGVTADDVMVPRADIIAVPESMPLDALIGVIKREGHSRLPVYRESLDDIIGMIHIRDVFVHMDRGAEFRIADILRKPLYVPPSKPVLDLLLEMRQARMHMAIVVDEYGGTDGLVTIEDVVEEIVGEIADEHDEPLAAQVVPRPDGTLDIDARLPVEEFERHLGPILSDDEREAEIETVGGLILALTHRIPARGETIAHPSGVEFRILDADSRRIRKVRVAPPPSRTPEESRPAA
ncbi:hemolysin family protein [Elioraea tepidiphila]|jgi:CBS domain containing-hemolysin-like protein|uniref:hemolysin family protein n=1 Tax=Elioraea tepidiphila TaxID=457934 RepID=UPI00036311E7|nr:hemolysin family protein [Elioraea tepidiphila]